MSRLIIHVEGQTEEAFVNEILQDQLIALGYHSVRPFFIGSPRNRGGICSWPRARNGIALHLKSDPGLIVTTMVDYYGLPETWPGRMGSTGLTPTDKALAVEDAIRSDLNSEPGPGFDVRRFVPFVVMHEFEGLLFSDCAALARGVGRTDPELKFTAIRNLFETPEHISDSPETAPSKRLEKHVPGYQKLLGGKRAALEIGLAGIRAQCPHFAGWLSRLESLCSELQ